MAQADFLVGLAGTLEGDFEMVSVVEGDKGPVLFVKNRAASAIVAATLDSALDTGIIRVSSVVVENLDRDDETLAEAVVMVNELNQGAPIGRWVYYPEPGTIQFEEEQLVMRGQEYDDEEVAIFRFLMTSIYNTIDHLDDNILARLGSGNLASEAKPDWA